MGNPNLERERGKRKKKGKGRGKEGKRKGKGREKEGKRNWLVFTKRSTEEERNKEKINNKIN